MQRLAFVRTAVLSVLLGLGGAVSAGAGSIESAAVARPAANAPAYPDATLSRGDENGATILRIDGIITRGLEQQLAAVLASLPPSRPLVIELSSPGGFTSAGYRLIDALLAERQAGRPVATRVRAGETCESMCVGVYLAGYPRYAAPSAEFMVHAPRIAETGQMTLRTTQTMVARLMSLGVSSGWIAKVTEAGGFSGAVDIRETAVTLAAAGANVVTDIVD
jgi:membrane-bound ClpP family serine protease